MKMHMLQTPEQYVAKHERQTGCNGAGCNKGQSMKEKSVTMEQVAKWLRLENRTPEIDLGAIRVSRANIHRPALQLTGFFQFFDKKRIEIMGRAEKAYMDSQPAEVIKERLDRLFSYKFPGMIMCRGIEPEPVLVETAVKYQVPLLFTEEETANMVRKAIQTLSFYLAPTDTMYGVLVDVYGEGIIITGKSGIGKSETAIELVKRGHRFVADDLIELSRISEKMIVGRAPELTKHLIELRGIGVVDAKSLFGVESVMEETQVDMIINLEEWAPDKAYDRLGLNEEYEEIFGVPIIKHSVPISPGRNTAIIVETAAVNNRQKKMGYNTAEALSATVAEAIRTKSTTRK